MKFLRSIGCGRAFLLAIAAVLCFSVTATAAEPTPNDQRQSPLKLTFINEDFENLTLDEQASSASTPELTAALPWQLTFAPIFPSIPGAGPTIVTSTVDTTKSWSIHAVYKSFFPASDAPPAVMEFTLESKNGARATLTPIIHDEHCVPEIFPAEPGKPNDYTIKLALEVSGRLAGGGLA